MYKRFYQEFMSNNFVTKSVKHNEFKDKVTSEEIIIGGPQYQHSAKAVKAKIHRLTSHLHSTPQPCLIFYHGGHGCAGSYADYSPIVDRYSVECQATVISVNYRLAPDHKVPSGMIDAFAAFRWVMEPENAKELDIDLNHVAIFGDDAGAWIAMAVS